MTDKNNVYQIRTGRALFTPNMRSEVSNSLSNYTDKPDEAAGRVEEALCTALVSAARPMVESFGNWLGKKISEKMVPTQEHKVTNIK